MTNRFIIVAPNNFIKSQIVKNAKKKQKHAWFTNNIIVTRFEIPFMIVLENGL
jgi:hypothetical protein